MVEKLTVWYVIEMMMALVGVRLCMRKHIGHVWWLILGAMLCVMISILKILDGCSNHMLAEIIAYIAVFLCIKEKQESNLLQMFLVWSGYWVIQKILLIYCYVYGVVGQCTIRETSGLVFLRCFISILIVAFIGVYHYRCEKTFISLMCLGLVLYCLFYMIFILGIGYFVFLNQVDDLPYRVLCKQIIFGGVIQLVILILVIVVMVSVEHQLRETKEQSESYRSAEKTYYEMILAREEDTRKFRHDIKKHFMVLQAMISRGNVEEAEKYLEELSEDIGNVALVYQTGNQVMDVLTNYWVNTLGENVVVNMYGGIAEGEIDNKDICIIYGNLLENAVEEVLRMEKEKEKFINIVLEEENKYIHLQIENTSLNIGNTRETKKTDEKNHGIGLKNVKSTVQKMGGCISVESRKKTFWVDVLLPKN